MNNDTIAFVTAGQENVLKIIQSVTKEINLMISNKLKSHLSDIGTSKIAFLHGAYGERHDHSNWTSSAYIHSTDFETFQIIFGIGDGDEKNADRRILWVNTDYSCDYSDTYEGEKIIFSTGSWGSHTDIMTAVIKGLVSFGKVYCRKNDADDFMAIGDTNDSSFDPIKFMKEQRNNQKTIIENMLSLGSSKRAAKYAMHIINSQKKQIKKKYKEDTEIQKLARKIENQKREVKNLHSKLKKMNILDKIKNEEVIPCIDGCTGLMEYSESMECWVCSCGCEADEEEIIEFFNSGAQI